MVNQSIKTTCPYCGVGCGILAEVDTEQRLLSITGDTQHPANYGRLCAKGLALADTVTLQGRLLQPQINGQVTDWEQALNTVADGFKRTIDQYGVDAVAIYASGQLLTEDYYVANKLMKGFVGSANIDTNSRLCMSSSVAGHKRAFGSDTVPGCYDDLELAELIILIGSNAAWCHPVIFQRIRHAKLNNPNLKVVVVDPRQTSSCDIADLHLQLAAATDTTLFNGLLNYLQQNQAVDEAYIQQHTQGFSAALAAASDLSIASVAEVCGLPSASIELFYRWFAQHPRVLSLYSQGVNQSSAGSDKVNSILNCHLATGRIGLPGMGPFSLTGQPNAMGGREVGGLAHQLAAHMDFTNPVEPERVARFWGSQQIAQQPGYPAVELFDAIYDGKVKAVWIMGTNPVVSLPNADKVKAALQRCPLVVVSDCIAETDTTELAHVLLPAQGWSEKDGTVTNSERRISRQRQLLPAAGDAKPDWWIICQVAKRLGFEQAFNYQSPVEIFREHAALSGFENDSQHGLRDFDISGLAAISPADYQQFQPRQWPINARHPQGCARLFADGQFFSATGKAQFVAISPRAAANPVSAAYPLILNTGRIRDQWHTMTRTALATKLNQHQPEAYVDIHPQTAASYGLSPQGLALIETVWGKMLARLHITTEVSPGSLFIPMHWSGQFASQGRVGALVNPALDPLSRQPECKHTPARISAYQAQWHGFVVTRQPLHFDDCDYWVKTPINGGYRYELAGQQTPDHWMDWFKNKIADSTLEADWLDYQDTALAQYRIARLVDNQLDSLLMVAQDHQLPARDWVSRLLTTPLTVVDRKRLLGGVAPQAEAECGRVVCVCYNLGETTLRHAIQQQGLTTVAEIGCRLKAGTNCGSCLAELKALLD